MSTEKDNDPNTEINEKLRGAEDSVKQGAASVQKWAENLKAKFAPQDQKRIEFNESEVLATLTKQGSIIIVFSNIEDAKKYFETIN